MNADTSAAGFWLKLERLRAGSDARVDAQRARRAEELAEVRARLDRFHRLVTDWAESIVVPRLEALRRLFPEAHPCVSRHASNFRWASVGCDEFPASAQLGIDITYVPSLQTLKVLFRADLVPALVSCEPGATLELEIRADESSRLAAFLDDRIYDFARRYLEIRSADSPYQGDRPVVDPVCRSTIHISEAVASRTHDGRTYYFCAEECRRLFEADPERYTNEVSAG